MTPDPTLIELTPAFKAMTPLQKWETLVLSGLIGTDEPWIEDMRQALREQETTLQGSAALPSEAMIEAGKAELSARLVGLVPGIDYGEIVSAIYIAMRATTPTPETGLVEALDLWRAMIRNGVLIGGQWVAVQVHDTNALHDALNVLPDEV